MGLIKEAERIFQAQKVLADSQALGGQLQSTVLQIKGLLAGWLTLRSMAEDADDHAVFDERLKIAIENTKSSVVFSDDEKKLLLAVLSQIVG